MFGCCTMMCVQYGEVAEWFKAIVLKTVVPKGTVSSNLTLSAFIWHKSYFVLVFRLMPRAEHIINFSDVSFEFGANNPILDEVNFSVREGMKVTLMGQNGAGKSTIFGLIMDELKPESGKVNRASGLSIATARQVIPRDELELSVREFFEKRFEEKIYDIDRRIDDVLEVVNFHVPKEKYVKD